MWTISDFLAYGMLSGWNTHKKMSCPYCMNHTKSFTLSHGRKPCFFDCHCLFLSVDHLFRRNRDNLASLIVIVVFCHCRFLSVDHPFRRNRDNFRKEKIKNDRPASRLFGEEVRDRVMELSGIPFGKNAASETISGFGESYNWVRRSILWELSYWCTNLRSILWELSYCCTNLIRHNLDVMHIEKNQST